MKATEKMDIRSRMNWKNLMRKYAIFIIFVVMCIILGLLTSKFLTVGNAINVAKQSSIYGIMALGLLLVIITGGIDLSISAALAVGSMATGMLAKEGTTVPLFAAIMAGIAVGIMVGAINGVMVTKLKVPAFIATLASSMSFRGVALLMYGGRPVIGLTEEFKAFGSGSLVGIPYIVLVWIALAVVFHLFLKNTSFGRHIYAVGGNETAAKTSGIRTDRVKMFVYMISGMMGAISGIVLAARVATASPVAANGYELDSIAGTVIGGTSLLGGVGTVGGTIIGVLIIGIITNGMDILNISAYYQQVIKGIVVATAVILDSRKN